MAYFPQLLSGASSQFPVATRVEKRTVVNAQADGRTWRFADPGGSRVEWRLEFAGLSRSEWESIEALFHAAEGRLGHFTFLDPAGNLLAHSEDLSETAWMKEPLLELTASVADPFGAARATRLTNSAGVTQKFEQTLNVPGWRQYCLSVYARSGQANEITLYGKTDTSVGSRVFAIGTEWRRLEYPIRLANTDEAMQFGVQVPAGASVEVFGFQVEPQAGASKYKKTAGRNGVYSEARFLDDVLTVRADAPERYSCVVRVGARM